MGHLTSNTPRWRPNHPTRFSRAVSFPVSAEVWYREAGESECKPRDSGCDLGIDQCVGPYVLPLFRTGARHTPCRPVPKGTLSSLLPAP